MGLNLTWCDVIHLYKCHQLKNVGYYLKSRSNVVRLISCIPKSNKGMKDDYLIVSGRWYDDSHCLIKEGKPGIPFANKEHMSPRLSEANNSALNRVLRSEEFVNEDLQVRATHLILGYDPLSISYQEVDNAIIEGDKRRRRIDVLKPDFLAPFDLSDDPSVILYSRPPKVTSPSLKVETKVVRAEITALPSSLDKEIDRFHLEEAERPLKGHIVDISNEESNSNRSFGIKGLIVARVVDSSEEEDMLSLKSLFAKRGAQVSKKGAAGSQHPPRLPLPPPPSDPTIPAYNLQRKRKNESTEGEKEQEKKQKQQQHPYH